MENNWLPKKSLDYSCPDCGALCMVLDQDDLGQSYAECTNEDCKGTFVYKVLPVVFQRVDGFNDYVENHRPQSDECATCTAVCPPDGC